MLDAEGKMVVCYAFVGVLVGTATAIAALLAGGSAVLALGLYALGGSVAVMLLALTLLLRPLAPLASCPAPDARAGR